MRVLAWLDRLVYDLIIATGGRVVRVERPPARLPLAVAPIDAEVLRRARARVNRAMDLDDAAVDRLARDVLTAPVSRRTADQLRLARSLTAEPGAQHVELEILGKLE